MTNLTTLEQDQVVADYLERLLPASFRRMSWTIAPIAQGPDAVVFRLMIDGIVIASVEASGGLVQAVRVAVWYATAGRKGSPE